MALQASHVLTSSCEQKRKLAETIEPVEPPSIAAQPSVMLADYISSMQAKSFSKMSGIELADVQIPGEYQSGSCIGAFLVLTRRQRAP